MRRRQIAARTSSKSTSAEGRLTDYVHFDVWAEGGSDLKDIAGAAGDRDARGRVRVGLRLGEAAAQTLAAEVRARGGTATVELHVPSVDEIQALDAGLADEPAGADGEPLDASELMEEEPDAIDDSRFAPPRDVGVVAELTIDSPATATRGGATRPGATGAGATGAGATGAAATGAAAALDAAAHDGDGDGDGAAARADDAALVRDAVPIPGWRGKLRENPPLRIGAGVALGLALGYLLSQPFANRAERRVAERRAEADRERYLSDDDSRRHVAALDAEADSQAARGALGAGVIWLAVAGGVFAGWWKLS